DRFLRGYDPNLPARLIRASRHAGRAPHQASGRNHPAPESQAYGHLIWPARELSVLAVLAPAWVFLRQRRSRRELSLSNTKAASLRPSRPINLRPEATAISSRSTAVGRSTERAERTLDVTQIMRAGQMPRPTR